MTIKKRNVLWHFKSQLVPPYDFTDILTEFFLHLPDQNFRGEAVYSIVIYMTYDMIVQILFDLPEMGAPVASFSTSPTTNTMHIFRST